MYVLKWYTVHIPNYQLLIHSFKKQWNSYLRGQHQSISSFSFDELVVHFIKLLKEFKCSPFMYTIFGLPKRKLDRGSKGHPIWAASLTTYISSPPGLCLPENFPVLICIGLTHTIFTWNDQWSNQYCWQVSCMMGFLIRFAAKVSDFIVTYTSTCNFINAENKCLMVDLLLPFRSHIPVHPEYSKLVLSMWCPVYKLQAILSHLATWKVKVEVRSLVCEVGSRSSFIINSPKQVATKDRGL